MIDVAVTHHWRVWHVPTPMRPIGGNKFVPESRGRGLPDLLMLHDDPPRMILAELKKEGGVVSDEQREFLRMARAVASESGRALRVFLWTPAHRDLIQATLRGANVT